MNVKNCNLRPVYFALQWHLTERCNWRCKHCYQEKSHIKGELPLKDLIRIFKQYLELIKHFDTVGPHRARLTLTGGEPLLRKDFFVFLEKIYRYNKYFLLSILSNGSLIDKESARKLKKLGVKIVQVSLEGMEINNDAIRGKGAFSKTIRAIEILVKSKINATVSFTLTKQNLSDVPALIKLCKKLRVSRLGIRRLVTIGKGEALRGYFLSPLELKRFYWYIEKKRKALEIKDERPKFFITRGCEEGIFSQEISQPLNSCAVVTGRILVALPNGDILPCRRLPIKVGNALESSLFNIYYNSSKLQQLRNLNNAYRICKECSYFDRCFSGAKCISYSYFNRLSSPDPQCWRLFRKLPDPGLFRSQKDISDKRQRVYFGLLPGVKR